jgi:hypothetical protein
VPHFKCEACRGRLYGASDLIELVGGLCPDCGGLLEPAGELSELIGFRSIRTRSESDDDRGPRQSAPVADLFAYRACHEQARADFERWSDDGGSLVAGEIALPHPETLR